MGSFKFVVPWTYQAIERTRRTAELRAQSLLGELEEEIVELQKKSAALSQLAASEDYILFLKVSERQQMSSRKPLGVVSTQTEPPFI